MKLRLTLLTVALFLSSVTPAVAQDVRYDFDKEKDFSKYKTYKWVPIKGADLPDDLTQKALTSAIDAQLATKGLTKTDSDDADLYVGYQTALGQEKEFTSCPLLTLSGSINRSCRPSTKHNDVAAPSSKFTT